MEKKREQELESAKATGDVFLDNLITPDSSAPMTFDNISEQKPELKKPVHVERKTHNPNTEVQNSSTQKTGDNLIDVDSAERLNRIMQAASNTSGSNPYSEALQKMNGKDKAESKKTPTLVQFANPDDFSDYDEGNKYHVVKNGQVVSTNDGNGGDDKPLFKVTLGSRFYAIPEIMLVSDDKGPAIARIYEGPLKGALLAGTYTLNELSKGLNIKLDRMTYNGRQYGVDALMLNLESGRPVLADDVDNHYFERYGAIGLAAMVTGFADTLKSTTKVIGSDGGVTVVEDPINKGKDQFIYALGQVGSVWANELTKNMNRPVTVTTYAGTGAQIMFMNEVEIY